MGFMHPRKSLDYKELRPPVTKVANERRKKQRFSFVTDLRYRMQGRTEWEGSGSTVNMNAEGILLTADRAFPLGAQIQLSLNWPGLYHDAERMLLLVTGTVVRSEGKRTALQILNHEFRQVPALQRSKTILAAVTSARENYRRAVGPQLPRVAGRRASSSSSPTTLAPRP
jgi:hypothetical protein